MLKGHVFKQQIFGNQIFALFINTFLDGANGISNNYKNSMETTYNGSTLTVQSGAVCIQGRFLEEDTSTDIAAGTDTAYCKLVIEIDLSKQNTESDFQQGAYKVIKGASAYPELTQNDIVKNNTGIYQYELARFKTSASGITEFQDMRTYLDFDSIYGAIQTEYRAMLEQLRQELEDVEGGSSFVMKNDIATVTTTLTLESGESTANVNYPAGFNQDNCIVFSFMAHNHSNSGGYGYGYLETAGGYMLGAIGHAVNLGSDSILIRIQNPTDGAHTSGTATYDIKIILMKI